jgi:hypothetical protein
MTTPDMINVVAAAISGVAVVVSVVALMLSGLANRKANKNTQRSNRGPTLRDSIAPSGAPAL